MSGLTYPMSFCGGAFVLEDQRTREGAMDFKLRVDSDFEQASTVLVERLMAIRPTLAEHACTSDDVDGCGESSAGHAMTVPHLVEHLAIDFIVERRPSQTEPVAGYTVWLDHRHGLARVTISSFDHAATEQAVHDACLLLEREYRL